MKTITSLSMMLAATAQASPASLARSNFTNTPSQPAFYHSVAVTTSPSLGLRSSYDGSDLVVNYPTLNEDLRLLKQRAAYAKQRQQLHTSLMRPLIEISGTLTGLLSQRDTHGEGEHRDVDLNTVELVVLAEVNPWVTGLITINYDNGPAANNSNLRVEHSRFYLKRGLITIGRLNTMPWYASVGQMYVPFGRYGSMAVSSPVTQVLGRARERAVVLGAHGDAVDAQIYAMRGEASKSGHDDDINAWGANADMHFHLPANLHGSMGVSMISNLADADASLHALGDGANTLNHNVPAMDARVNLSTGPWQLSAEYVAAVRHYDAEHLGGERPRAFYTEARWKLPHSAYGQRLGMGYGFTHGAADIHMPKKSWMVAMDMHVWKSTTQTLEFRRNVQYTGAATGNNDDQLLAQFSLFF